MKELEQAYDNLKAGIYELALNRGELETLNRQEFHEIITNKLMELIGYAREIEFIHYSQALQEKAHETKVEGL